jgi:hypothetical protein
MDERPTPIELLRDFLGNPDLKEDQDCGLDTSIQELVTLIKLARR